MSRILVMETFQPNCEDGVAARRGHVELMGGVDAILEAKQEILNKFLAVLALEHKEVLDGEFFILVPAQSEAPHIGPEGLRVQRGGV